MHPVAAAGFSRAAWAERLWVPWRALPALLAALLLAGCGAIGGASPTPAYAVNDVIGQLVVRGVTVEHVTSGDAGCPGSQLHSNGVHLQVAMAGEAGASDIYLLNWLSSAAFAAAAADFDSCVAEYQTAHPGVTIDQVALDPWRAYGANWSPDLHSTLASALQAASGG
jgi:hypothetical protein